MSCTVSNTSALDAHGEKGAQMKWKSYESELDIQQMQVIT